MRRGNGTDAKSAQMQQLRAEVEQLKAERAAQRADGSH